MGWHSLWVAGGRNMTIQDAKAVIGTQVRVSWTDRKGDEISEMVHVLKVDFVPLYGPCLITDIGEICLNRIVNYVLLATQEKVA